MKLKNTIQEHINRKGWRQEDVAIKAGVRREYLNRIINGKIIPSVSLALRIADALSIKVDDIFILER